MTLLDAIPPPKPRKIGRYILLALVILMVGGTLYIVFRNYPEERAVSRFLTTLEQGNFREAYLLWQPSPTYSYQDFLHGWASKVTTARSATSKSWVRAPKVRRRSSSPSPSTMSSRPSTSWLTAKPKGSPIPYFEKRRRECEALLPAVAPATERGVASERLSDRATASRPSRALTKRGGRPGDRTTVWSA